MEAVTNSRDTLLSSIRQGGTTLLKPVDARPTPAAATPSEPTDVMAGMLAKALQDRSKKMGSGAAEHAAAADDDDGW